MTSSFSLVLFCCCLIVCVLSSSQRTQWKPDDQNAFVCEESDSAPSCDNELREKYFRAKTQPTIRVHDLTIPNFDEEYGLTSQQVDKALNILSRYGVVAFPKVVPCPLLSVVAKDVEDTFPVTREGDQLREDTPLTGQSAVYPLRKLLRGMRLLLEKIYGDLESAEIVEFSLMSTFPGSKYQRVHADTVMTDPITHPSRSILHSLFVTCQDTTNKMGPLTVWPQTHVSFHFAPPSFTSQYLERVSGVPIGSMPCGSVIMYDSRLFHHGRENRSYMMRHMFYITLRKKGEDKPEDYDERPYSLHPSFKGFSAQDILYGRDISD
eukprot:PhF_6_TR21631/c0_g1_i1/m.30788